MHQVKVIGKVLLINVLIIILQALSAYASSKETAEVICHIWRADEKLESINREIGRQSLYRFYPIFTTKSDEFLKKIYSDIKIIENPKKEYVMVVTTTDFKYIRQFEVDIGNNIDKNILECMKINGIQCYVLAIYNKKERICLMYSDDYRTSGDELKEIKTNTQPNRYSFGD
ncbi:hypothetical protein [Bartonella sp. LJL80]